MIYIGTAGYSYKDWIGPFYPEGIKNSNMLQYYSEHFKFVEINSSFYNMPGIQLFKSIARKTPQDFKVSVKLYRGFTHERSANPGEAGKFIYSIQPLIESGKLVCILAQFPYSFHYNQQNVEYLKELRKWFGDIEMNVEFRNRDWIRQDVVRLIRQENLGFVCVDEPDLKGLVKGIAISTSNVSYLRLHGRNAAKWYEGEGSERYDYLYSPDELAEWVPRIRELEKSAAVTVISFNNHPRGKAVQNAKMLEAILRQGI